MSMLPESVSVVPERRNKPVIHTTTVPERQRGQGTASQLQQILVGQYISHGVDDLLAQIQGDSCAHSHSIYICQWKNQDMKLGKDTQHETHTYTLALLSLSLSLWGESATQCHAMLSSPAKRTRRCGFGCAAVTDR